MWGDRQTCDSSYRNVLSGPGRPPDTTRTHHLPSSSHLSYMAGIGQNWVQGSHSNPLHSQPQQGMPVLPPSLPVCLPASFYLHSGLLQLASGLCPLEQGAIVQLPPEASGPLSAERFSLRPGPLALCHLWAEDREPRSLAGKGGMHLQNTHCGL